MSWDFPEYPQNWEQLKRQVLKRDGYRCTRCGANNLPLHVHHKRSLSHGGTNRLSNLISLCEYCHSLKHPWLKTTGARPAHISNEHYFYCPRCKIEYSIDYADRFCSVCRSFLLHESREVITPVSMTRQGCFIVTAAYGSPLAIELNVFRNFRDSFIMRNIIGKKFAYMYYLYSPPLSKVIASSSRRRFVVRILLNKLLKIIK